MKTLMEALNHPAAAFERKSKAVAWSMVMITILIDSIFEPILQHLFGENTPVLHIARMLRLIGLGVVSYILVCLALWLVCKCLGSKTSLMNHISAWGLSFAPTAICAVVVAFTEVFFYIFWNSTIWGMIFNVVFVAILIWKTILYFIYLRECAKLKGWRFIVACIVMGVIIIVMAAVNGRMGLKTPII